MVQMETQSAGSARAYPHQEFYLILYPKELEDDNPVWPGATGAVFTVILPEEARTKLLPPFEALAASLETRSHGLYGLHIFALPCEQII